MLTCRPLSNKRERLFSIWDIYSSDERPRSKGLFSIGVDPGQLSRGPASYRL